MLIKWEFLGHNMYIHSNPRVTYCVPGTLLTRELRIVSPELWAIIFR